MAFFVKDTDILIKGTLEQVETCYPIHRGENGKIGWDYSGGESRVFDEGARIKTNADGDDLFLGEDGNEYPEPVIEWRD
ncbi:hypothetical protein [Sinorhizobium sp. CCBAU 05631]|uniref:hypothetical protein n=1 Tax=Sinorhizobium sp. CCBAU 05631 TaxID=794846 RepID=UPI0004B445FA|nr:hypothetical protein [Sinorhizobium sp. CCBAU 05631]ASY61381.1 hypothetical protein SS05631_d64800 [Sinorhizobium sp. CCBAU 05631]